MAEESTALTEFWLIFGPYLELCRLHVNDLCSGLEPWQVVAYTFGFTLILVWLWEFVFQHEEGFFTRMKKSFFRFMRKLPIIKGKVAEEIEKTNRSMENTFHRAVKGQTYIQTLPAKGLDEAKLMKELQKYKALADTKWGEGACSGTVYSGDEKLGELMGKVYGQFAWTNPLHADVFPDVRKMEAEVVRMCCNMFNGNDSSCGCMTTGGTESILLAIKTFRDRAYDKGIKYPEMVVPITAHAAFDKGAHYFRLKIKHIAVDPVTRKVDTRAMFRAVNKNTCMLVGSAPQFGHGIMDPITEIAKIGKRYDIPVHVDSCLGGFLVPFMKKAGFELPPFDFSVDGVTSISADTHKYGFAPKGSSVLLYSNTEVRKFQYFVQPDWPGGIYACPTIGGSRAGAIIAACWATMMYIGEEGYIDSTRKIVNTTRYIEKRLAEIPGLFIFGQAEVSVVGVGSRDFNIYRLTDAMTEKGWNLNALQFPSSLHLCVTLVHTKEGIADHFISDMEECTKKIMADPKAECGGQAALYGMAQSIPDRSLVMEMAGGYFDAYYCTTVRKDLSDGKS